MLHGSCVCTAKQNPKIDIDVNCPQSPKALGAVNMSKHD